MYILYHYCAISQQKESLESVETCQENVFDLRNNGLIMGDEVSPDNGR